ncbi:4503_t:CDS:2, partial [Acaulospora morrowiae]
GQSPLVQQPTPPATPSSDGHINTLNDAPFSTASNEIRFAKVAEKKSTKKLDPKPEYIEPGILEVKHYGKQTFDTALSTYKTHAKPYVDPQLEIIQPHLQTAKELSIDYVYTPAQKLYDQHAKEHVDKYYDQAKKFATPILLQSQEYAIGAYKAALEHNEKTVTPFYHEQIVPRVGQAKDYYHAEVVPFTKKLVKLVVEKYNEQVVPLYRIYIEPHFINIWDLVQDLINPEAKLKAEEEAKRKEAERREKAEAELKAREEAKRLEAKKEADRRAKEAADRKAKEEADRKAKEEADRKAKEEADRKAKEEADRKAKEEADQKIKELKAFNDTIAAELPRYQHNILSDIDKLIILVQSTTKDTLKDIETKSEIIMKSKGEHTSEIEKIVKMDSVVTEKDIDQKILSINEYFKKKLEDIKEITRESTKEFEDSLTKLVNRFDNDLQGIIDKRSSETRSIIFSKASDQNNAEITEDVERKISKITKEVKDKFSARIEPEISKIKTKIESIKNVARGVAEDIINIKRSATKSLKQQSDTLKSGAQEKPESEKSKGDQKPVEKVEPSKDSSLKDKDGSRDPVLEQLKKRYRLQQDPVLQKLKASYNERKKSVSIDEEEVEEEDDY